MWDNIAFRLRYEDELREFQNRIEALGPSKVNLFEMEKREKAIRIWESEWQECRYPTWACGTSSGLVLVQGPEEDLIKLLVDPLAIRTRTMQAEVGFLTVSAYRRMPQGTVPLWTWAAEHQRWLLRTY